MIISAVILLFFGFLVALYSYYVEQKIKTDISYQPSCDVSEKFSCTKPMLSPYANLLGFSNGLVAVIFYTLMLTLAVLGQNELIFYLSGASLVVSAVLAYILYFKIKTLCPLCHALYVINILVFAILYFKR